MQYEEVTDKAITLLDREELALLIVESTIPHLRFESNHRIPANPPIKEVESGIWHVFVKPGVHLITIQAEGYVSLQDIRHNFHSREAWCLRVTPKPILGAYTAYDADRAEIRLNYTLSSPDEARALWERLEVHHTPRHGSWLNIAGIELRVLMGQCLNRRIPDENRLIVKSINGNVRVMRPKPELIGISRLPKKELS